VKVYILYAYFYDIESPHSEVIGVFDSPGILNEMQKKYEAKVLEIKQSNPISKDELELVEGDYTKLDWERWKEYSGWKHTNKFHNFDSCWSQELELNQLSTPNL